MQELSQPMDSLPPFERVMYSALSPNSDGLQPNRLQAPKKLVIQETNCNGLQPRNSGLQPNSNGLQPNSDGLQPNRLQAPKRLVM